MFRDPELPGGFQDADFEMRDIEAAGRRSSEARKRGLCDHGWQQQGTVHNDIPRGYAKCLHCGKYGRVQELMDDRRKIHGGF